MIIYLKRLKSSKFVRVKAFPMYGCIGMSAPSLHRESTDSLIAEVQIKLLSLCIECVQWNPSNADTIVSEESVLIWEVSLFQGLKSTQPWYLGRKKVSCLERCPYFRGVLIEGIHCICTTLFITVCFNTSVKMK